MKTNMIVPALTIVAAAAAAQAGNLLWDFGPSAGTPVFCWSNTDGGQEFFETTQFGSAVNIDEYHYFACFSGLKNNTFQIEAKEDLNADGIPDNANGKYLFQDVPDSETDLGNGIYEYVFTFPNCQQNANEKLYWGCAGVGFEAALMGVSAPDNNSMYQFNGNTFSSETGGTGDQMFQLWGNAVPAPGAAGLLGLGALCARRRR
jgi:MYXO-CTERM domain-containing protein